VFTFIYLVAGIRQKRIGGAGCFGGFHVWNTTEIYTLNTCFPLDCSADTIQGWSQKQIHISLACTKTLAFTKQRLDIIWSAVEITFIRFQ